MKKTALLFLGITALFTSCKKEEKNNFPEGLYAAIETSKGEITVQLEFEKTPVTVANFVALAEGNHPMVEEKYKNKPFYDGLTFHRVISDFMIQGGDPDGTGSGGPGYKFDDEITEDLKHDKAGVLSMANAGPGTNGSQFFITHNATPHLDGMHTVFGHVIKGQDVVNTIVQGDKITSVTIIRSGENAKKFDAPNVFKTEIEKQAIVSREKEAQTERIISSNNTRLAEAKANASKTKNGVAIFVFEKGTEGKPKKGDQILVDYAGFFEDGNLFDTSIEEIATEFNTLDSQRKAANAYRPIPFEFGTKTGLIPGFIEGIEHLNYGDKALVFIPAHLAYGERGAGNGIIPPNTDLVFELHIRK